MQAIILAAGRARRMQPISDHVHKALLPIGSSTILGRIVDNLVAVGVTRLTVVTGYRAQDVRAFLESHHPGLDVRYVHNSRFERTNNIVSLAMAFDSMSFDEDIILCECDLLLDPEVLSGLEDSAEPNVAVVDRWRPGMDGTVVTVAEGFVEGVFPPDAQGPEFNYKDTFKTLNIYRFSRAFVQSTLHPIMSAYANSVDDNCYYEVVLAMLAGIPRHRIAAHVVDTAAWIEVDDPNDLEIARFHFEPESRAEILDRSFGGYWNFGVLDYSFIANQYFPPPALTAMMRRALPDLLSSYGSAQSVLNRKMALFVQCDPAHVLMLNGASEVYPVLRRLWAGDSVAIPSPTFGEYGRHFPTSLRYEDGPGVDLGDLHDAAGRARRLVVVNPNNPSGTLLETADVLALAKDHPETTVLVDESFIATSAQPSIVPMIEANPLENVVVLTSLSKVLGVPGLRVGYLYSRDQGMLAAVADELQIWGNSSLAEFFVEMLVKFRPALERSIESTVADAAQFSEALRSLPGVEEVRAGAGSFVLVSFGHGSVPGAEIRRRLLERHRIEVKDVSGRFADGGVRLRLAVRRPADNRRLLEALAPLLDERE